MASSTVPAASTTTSLGSPSATSTSTSSSPNPTLPFSFLIALVAIFVFFLGCGFGSRRLSIELRRNLGRLQANGGRAQPPIPALWDPLSVTYIRQEEWGDTAPALPRRPRLPLRQRIIDYIPFFSLLVAVRAMRRARAHPGINSLEAYSYAHGLIEMPPPPPPVRALQVTVLVAMPSPDRPYAKRPLSMDSRLEDAAINLPRLSYAGGLEQDAQKRVSTGKERASVTYIDSPLEETPLSILNIGEYAIGTLQMPWEVNEGEM
ncbi:uncharacterized protein FIBRA_02268 [Fibroporia radiculosa]|uniref:Uncharacterized protein n=1 Tax=Fibroporia radiculosa TaxID=599839 RepID=J4H1R6_9APHY|nr:uncharacterized protein FIBRA_02268 [Fibroporia radiculosa]CCM00239.1 predicted protein [Fibroporia radiculosa]